ncbi:MAG: hypothetical protein ACPH5P_00035 [Akkermansiaceae bacterium]
MMEEFDEEKMATAMTVAEWGRMWDVPVWKAQARLLQLLDEGIVVQLVRVDDGKETVCYFLNTDTEYTRHRRINFKVI